jgi:hypothetical protein
MKRALAAACVLLASPLARAQQDPTTIPNTFTPEENTLEQVQIHGVGWSSPRGLGDLRITRDQLDAAPHQQTSEMLSAAPGFFVDHEDGEGLGNDVHLRGFDLEHGSGIEMRIGSIPINVPLHILGQGYADVSFVIPEVVRGVRVLEGTYDPRQGDAAIVGSAYFDLGVAERGTQVKTSYGSFNQVRALAIIAPRGLDEESFAAFSIRHSDGFGENRASDSASMNAQYGFDVTPSDHLRFTTTAYAARSELAGVVRQDDVDAGRIGFYDSYANFGQNQSVQSARIILGADFDHETHAGGRFELEPFFMWTDLDSRANYTGDLESSQQNPSFFGLGDLFQLTNLETAMGLTSRYHTAPIKMGSAVEAVIEPGVFLRYGHTEQEKNLLRPTDLTVWDRRIDDGLDTFDAAAYVDADVRIAKKLRISGGLRADVLGVNVDDHLALATRGTTGVVVGPRITAEYAATRAFAISASYGEGFRSLDAAHLAQNAQPYSRVRSVEAGVRANDKKKKWVTSLAVFDTFVDNELVFEAEAGGLETENASTRRGVVGSIVARPLPWLFASAALSVTNAVFTTLVAGVSHDVPSVSPIILRVDASVHHAIGRLRGKPVEARAGVGYTFLAGAHLTDAIIGPDTNALNAQVAARWDFVELGVDGYNVLGLKYADDAEVYVSNWSNAPGQQPASLATHLTAAPPATVIGTVALYF